MPTPVEDYVMDPGVDPTSTFGGYAPTLNQMVSLETPNSYRGMTVYSSTAPAVTGQPTGYPTNWYAWNKRNLWINSSTGALSVYVTGSGWITPGFANNTLDGVALKDSSVNITKFLPGTGNGFKIIRVNAGGTAFEFIDPATLYAPGTFNISVITPGADGTMAVSSGGITQWVNATTYIGTAIAPTIAGVISTAYAYTDAAITDYDAGVQFGAIASQVYYFNGTSKVWGYADTLLRTASVALGTLNVTAETGLNILRVNAGHTAVESVNSDVLFDAAFTARMYATPPASQVTFDPYTYGVHSATYVHGIKLNGLAAIPSQVRWVLIPAAAIGVAAAGDEIAIECFESTNGSKLRSCIANTTSISMASTVTPSGVNWTLFGVNINSTTWKIKAYASI